nr:uracil-DNA glycosylase [Atopobacter phocae]
MNNIAPGWKSIVDHLMDTPSYHQLTIFLEKEYQEQTIYPALSEQFKALAYTDYNAVKVCILGQDPYHGPGQANGLAFSVPSGVKLPPSLRNIYKELSDEFNAPVQQDGDLTHWAEQGVLLLNTVLTVRAHQAHSHQNKGWEEFTDGIIEALSQREDPVIFILWGNAARQKKKLIQSHHLILESAHPSPLSAYRGFFGSKVFSTCNKWLVKMGKTPINWLK